MDKKGIFSLINSMYEFYKNDYAPQKTESENGEKPKSLLDGLSSLLNFGAKSEKILTENKSDISEKESKNLDKNSDETIEKEIENNSKNLRQTEILYAIKSHNEFIKRVKNNNKK